MPGAVDAHDYQDRAQSWASAVWASWGEQHVVIRSTLDAVLS
jgi:hypothetical protein